LPSSNLRGNNKKLLRVFDKKRRKQQQKKKTLKREQKEEKKEEQKERKTEGGLSISPWLSTVVRALLINQQKLIFFAFIVKTFFPNITRNGIPTTSRPTTACRTATSSTFSITRPDDNISPDPIR
jgi:hypothetical protein